MSNLLDIHRTSKRLDHSGVGGDLTRLAVIGCGPRGLQCLDAVCRNLPEDMLARLDITVYEPCKTLGAGCVYDPQQPHVLRMNFASQNIDFWKTDADSTTLASTSLIGWLRDHYPKLAADDQYVPRAIVGEYLNECYASVERKLGGAKSYEVVNEQVGGVQRLNSCWEVTTEIGANRYDLVVVTTGHEGFRRSESLNRNGAARFVFPVQTNLSEKNFPPKSRVFVRGFGLTAIDAVLAMTEGRGGSFSNSPSRTYQPSGREPAKLVLHSRSGRPMLAKPTAAIEQVSDHFWNKFRVRLAPLDRLSGSINFQSDIWSVVHQAAAELLSHSGDSVSARDVAQWYRGWARYRMSLTEALDAMQQSFLVSIGERPRDIASALGEAWRKLYPEIVAAISYGGLSKSQWPRFLSVASEMERIAFGPPSQSVRQVLSLVDAGIVVLTNQDEDVAASQFDLHIDAVIAAPHQPSSNGPLASLISQGLVELDDTTGAVKVDATGEAIQSRTNNANSGLYIFGRATEGWVVGNDTLSRTLHDHIEQWSHSLATRMVKLSRNE
ncbi:FAD/NAD(P)-binding protein [Rubripirellula reticaptiva]|uniref:FAD-dependent urate hydroxylase HpyO/Asp monooxygenase CreE-like FAD/NAD(P)-binding domain-containing protein n=1 Tax=Rubripirellula reticaptiva TaxID=2528013 RepID=A0A5C6ED07_9BACT|nr:FAD/NAD(P)-binding domain-containing protein [Rubripirellula reticaptiva]TWU46808.1 hypothetical protein Poly59_57810 [Rubripirellula reticaptiva]